MILFIELIVNKLHLLRIYTHTLKKYFKIFTPAQKNKKKINSEIIIT